VILNERHEERKGPDRWSQRCTLRRSGAAAAVPYEVERLEFWVEGLRSSGFSHCCSQPSQRNRKVRSPFSRMRATAWLGPRPHDGHIDRKIPPAGGCCCIASPHSPDEDCEGAMHAELARPHQQAKDHLNTQSMTNEKSSEPTEQMPGGERASDPTSATELSPGRPRGLVRQKSRPVYFR
jgi:hypothetical protein